MPTWRITWTRVIVVEAPTQAAAVLIFERAHPGQGGSIVKVEQEAEAAEARARRDE